jgi:hypothetical protein
VTDRYKLVHFYTPDVDYWELFDRQSDPHELQSVYGEARYAEVQSELHAELKRLREELKVPAKDDPVAYGGRRGLRQNDQPKGKAS